MELYRCRWSSLTRTEGEYKLTQHEAFFGSRRTAEEFRDAKRAAMAELYLGKLLSAVVELVKLADVLPVDGKTPNPFGTNDDPHQGEP